MFLIFHHNQGFCSYKMVLIKKRVLYVHRPGSVVVPLVRVPGSGVSILVVVGSAGGGLGLVEEGLVDTHFNRKLEFDENT